MSLSPRPGEPCSQYGRWQERSIMSAWTGRAGGQGQGIGAKKLRQHAWTCLMQSPDCCQACRCYSQRLAAEGPALRNGDRAATGEVDVGLKDICISIPHGAELGAQGPCVPEQRNESFKSWQHVCLQTVMSPPLRDFRGSETDHAWSSRPMFWVHAIPNQITKK